MQKIVRFLKEVREILFQITWPKKEALIQLSIVVISISIIVSLFLGGLDYLFTNSIGLITNPPTGGPKTNTTEVSTESASITFTPIETSTPSATVTPKK